MATTPSAASKTGGPRLSVTIIAKNEERTIREALASVVEIADEMVVVDSGSTDRTVEIAQRFGARLYRQEWLGYAAQKNIALDLASGDWVLSLDADEIVTPALAAEIREVLRGGVPEKVAGFKIPRLLFIGDAAVPGGGFYPDAQLRLIRKGKGRFRSRLVHESIQVEGEVRQLKHDMLHYAYRDAAEFAAAMDEYARLSARHFFETGYGPWQSSRMNEILLPFWTLFYRQIIRGGVLQGKLVWQLNLMYADYVRKKVRYLRQLSKAQRSAS